jgi:hypothetical protein
MFGATLEILLWGLGIALIVIAVLVGADAFKKRK